MNGDSIQIQIPHCLARACLELVPRAKAEHVATLGRRRRELAARFPARRKSRDVSCEEVESSMRIPLEWWLRVSSGPAAQQERPKGHGTGKNQNPKTDAGADCLRVDSLHSGANERHGEDDSEDHIQRQRIDEQNGNSFKHFSPRSVRRHPSYGGPARRKATTPVRQHFSAAPIWKNPRPAWTCDLRECPLFPAERRLPSIPLPCFPGRRYGRAS